MLEIRTTKREDLWAMAVLEKKIFSDAWSKKALEETFEQESARIFAAFEDGNMAGYCIAYQILDEAEIARIAVDKDRRRNGIGGLLLEQLKKISKNQGGKRILLDVREGNFAARAFYEKEGFQIDGTRKGFYRNPKEDAVLMSLTLQEVSTTSQ
ncbi:ribosomal protein S18-alanine N-acetyltransferase [Lachnoclostridium sp. An181]|uniref:ribosomal protein S18-alanine N-acetyltransferase n=1 Tax=Lachnoclostridium sp. An181 TaxID=1965575 RepID=UPI000B3679B6|nr:ribosomal protein S18-alanine N-acetyltransferase [Lachnoclostridium sp. An181]OUP48741.1 ribosomal-protein-alanine N-acetyltransferase [Lachnoclostridium sp. An181]